MRVVDDPCELYFKSASRISIVWVELYFCKSPFNFCESHLTSASRIWLLRVAPDFYESHMTFASRSLCKSRFIVRVVFYCASRVFYVSHTPKCGVVLYASCTLLYESYYVRVALYNALPFPPSPPCEIRVLALPQYPSSTRSNEAINLMRLLSSIRRCKYIHRLQILICRLLYTLETFDILNNKRNLKQYIQQNVQRIQQYNEQNVLKQT